VAAEIAQYGQCDGYPWQLGSKNGAVAPVTSRPRFIWPSPMSSRMRDGCGFTNVLCWRHCQQQDPPEPPLPMRLQSRQGHWASWSTCSYSLAGGSKLYLWLQPADAADQMCRIHGPKLIAIRTRSGGIFWSVIVSCLGLSAAVVFSGKCFSSRPRSGERIG
jgi:hypothetical protein